MLNRTSLSLCLLLSVTPAWGGKAVPHAPDTPVSKTAQSIGEPNNGCIAGAVALPTEGAGYQAMHLERKRFYGHPLLIQAITSLAQTVLADGGHLQVGDLGLVRGGPMPFGHRSHQTGLDADVWFDLEASDKLDALRANVSARSLLNAAKTGLDQRLWSDRQVKVLRATARLPQVDRVFVNPHIKRELCRLNLGREGWLSRIRPWYGHDDHFHMRLACPGDSPACVRQASLPEGDGCDASLAWWFEVHPPEPVKPAPPKPPLPTACLSVLKAGP